MIYLGNSEIQGIYLGSSEISAIYAGTEQIYPMNFGNVTAITISGLTWVTDVPSSGGTADSGNCSFKVIALYDSGKMRNITSHAQVSGSLIVPATTAETREMVGTLTLTASYSGFTDSDSVDVYQAAYSKDYSKEYLTFIITSNGLIKWFAQNNSYRKTIEYSLNGGNWTSITSSNGSSNISVVTGDIVKFRGNNAQYAPQDGRCSAFSGCTCGFELEGNVMSMVDSVGFSTATTFSANNVFMNFFNNCTGLTSVDNLVMPATVLTNYCYQGMFANCKNLVKAPELIASTMVTGCYNYMFYQSSKINYIKCLATNPSGLNYTFYWTNGVSSSGTFIRANSINWSRGTSAVPNNWTIIDNT